MHKIHYLLVIAVLFAISGLKAQSCANYVQPANERVKDGSMEYFSMPCNSLTMNNATDNATLAAGYPCCFWKGALVSNSQTLPVGTPDYFNICANVPTNNAQAGGSSAYAGLNWQNFNTSGSGPVAYIPVAPHTGNAYSGIAVFQGANSPDSREYIYSQLASTLTAGASYQLSLWVRLSPNSEYGIKDLSVLLSNIQPTQFNNNPFPQVITPVAGNLLVQLSNTPITNKNGWVQYIVNVTAPVGSNFSYLTIGNFKSNSSTTVSGVLPVGNISFPSYYYIDDVSLKPCGNLTPSISGNSSFCLGSSIGVTGSVSGGTPASHSWGYVECDAAGNVIAGATPWWSAQLFGTVGSYGFVSNGTQMKCGKYYLVRLAVNNACGQTQTATKVIYINCPPTINLNGSATSTCAGNPAGISAGISGGSGNYTMNYIQLSPSGGTIYSGPPSSIMVSPTVTTTYQVTATDNVTGCTAGALHTITMATPDPSFSLSVNTGNPNYFTVALTANDLNAYTNYTGFQYGLTIEELDAFGNPNYSISSISGTTCWWNYPTPEAFLGFVSLAPGSFTHLTGASGCGSAAGQFQYNRTYRITRLVLTDMCSPVQYSMLISTVKSGEVIVNEDLNAPDLTHLLGLPAAEPANEGAIRIFPNPTEGMLNISCSLAETAGVVLTLTDVSGRTVLTQDLYAGTDTWNVDLTAQKNGIYFVHLFQAGQLLETQKVFLNH